MTQKLLFDVEPSFTNRRTAEVTFQGKLTKPIHRWYRLTPSFSPKLAHDIADHWKLGDRDFVLDPFSGVGTVPLCMKYRGIPSCSVEINPYLHFVGTVKTRTYQGIEELSDVADDFAVKAQKAIRRLPASAEYLAANEVDIPQLHNIERWWSSGNLAQLVCLRRLILDFTCDPIHHEFLKMGMLSILIPVSNAKHNHVSLTFADKPLETVDVAEALHAKYRDMIQDLRDVQALPCAKATVYSGNSKSLSTVLPKSPKPSAVITSPPYPNRFSYARETRPHLFFFDFIESAKAVGELETDAIGGTWGKATSVLASGVNPKNETVASLLAPYVGDITSKGSLMASYVVKYFNDMYDHAEQISLVCRKKARLAYVIGNSKFYDHPLPSDEILAGIFKHHGFDTDRIDRMRKRQSKSGLYEAVVFMERH